jgi:hypothetical protein
MMFVALETFLDPLQTSPEALDSVRLAGLEIFALLVYSPLTSGLSSAAAPGAALGGAGAAAVDAEERRAGACVSS